MKRKTAIVLASVGGLVVFGALFALALVWALFSPPALPDRFVLALDLEAGFMEAAPGDPFLLALDRHRLRVRDVVDALHAAADDDRVVGLWANGGRPPGGWGVAAELREAVEHFRASGKPAVLFAETFGEMVPAHSAYHVATAFDEIVLQPSGEVGVGGFSIEAPFLRGAFEKLEIEPRFDARMEYKDATDIFMRTGFSDPSREALTDLLASLMETLTEGIAEGRGLPRDSVQALLDLGPFPAALARDVGLVDRLGYRDESRDRFEDLVGDDPEFVALRRYRDGGGRAWDRGARVAVVTGVGPIHRGSSGYDPLGGGTSMGASSVASAIRSAADDERVRAILFRVDSPGGGWVASDVIRREVRRARDAGKPVVVSMGNAGASGGYLVAVEADRIVAHPTTFTGSIGVAGGRFVLGGFFASLGITWDRVEVGETDGFFTGVEDFSEEEWRRFQASLDRVYDDFVEHVARGRGLGAAEIDVVARGRVWTGRDALARGLVDALGGYGVALEHVRELADLEPDAPIQLAVYPAERTLFQLLLDEGRGVRASGGGAGDVLRGLVRTLGAIGAATREPARVRMPPFVVPGG